VLRRFEKRRLIQLGSLTRGARYIFESAPTDAALADESEDTSATFLWIQNNISFSTNFENSDKKVISNCYYALIAVSH